MTSRRATYRRSRPRRSKSQSLEDDIDETIRSVFGIVVAILIVWTVLWNLIIEPHYESIVATLTFAGKVLLGMGIVAISAFTAYKIYDIKKESEREREYRRFEAEMNAKGYVKYFDINGNERWGTPEEAEKQNYFYQVIRAIIDFVPPRKYENERGYHDTLFAWLKSRFPNAKMEYQVGASRPDIVIEIGNVFRVAIEVKGPTRSRDLQTIADKILRYGRYFDNIIVVLFDVVVNETRYREWLKGVEETFPGIVILRKD